ncbi:unnamed protein product [Brassica napus]|uniref:(rape) hypothetical protein n=1 Tax=Brassica napus TaxID=3708 RepID=A0A816ZWM9_BRANA|nr:unnamed protein product [Brassica napus]
MFSYNRRHWSTKQDIRQICTAKPLRSKHKMKKNNKRKLMLNSVTVIKKEKHQKSMKGIHLRKNKKNKWKLIQKLKSPCKLKGRNEEEEVSIRKIKRKEKMKRMRKLRRNFKMKMADGYESPCNYDDTKGAPNDENEEEEISGGKRNATDDENDEEEISDTQQLTEVNILRENENT